MSNQTTRRQYGITCAGCGKSEHVLLATTRFCKPCMVSFWHARCKAGAKVALAVRAGKLPAARLLSCVDCGSEAQVYDHRDYEKPLSVDPVCRRCNVHRGTAQWHDTYLAVSLKWRNDSRWPWHPKGRPVLDVAKMAA